MVARTYYTLIGPITGVVSSTGIPTSSRGKDQDDTITLQFECSASSPFTGVIAVQGNMADITTAAADKKWFDLATLTFTAEAETVGLQIEAEVTELRVICRTFTSGRIDAVKTMR